MAEYYFTPDYYCKVCSNLWGEYKNSTGIAEVIDCPDCVANGINYDRARQGKKNCHDCCLSGTRNKGFGYVRQSKKIVRARR